MDDRRFLDNGQLRYLGDGFVYKPNVGLKRFRDSVIMDERMKIVFYQRAKLEMGKLAKNQRDAKELMKFKLGRFTFLL